MLLRRPSKVLRLSQVRPLSCSTLCVDLRAAEVLWGAFLGGSGDLRAVARLPSWWPAWGRLSPGASNDARGVAFQQGPV